MSYEALLNQRLADGHSVADSAYRVIKEAIIRNNLPKGQFHSISDLTRQFGGIGRTPIREAVQRLHEEQFVIMVPRKGVFIPEISIKFGMNLLDIRFMLEKSSYIEAAKTKDEKMLADVAKVIDEIRATQNLDMYSYTILDMKFHMRIIESLSNQELNRLMRRLNDHLRRIYCSFKLNGDRFPVEIEEHNAILEAIKKNDEKDIREAVEQHYLESKKYLLDCILK